MNRKTAKYAKPALREITYVVCILAASLAISGCATKPEAARANLSTDLETGFLNVDTTDISELPTSVDWWTQLEASTFEALIDQMLDGNLTLKEASERIEQSLERIAVQQGGRYPSVTIDGSKTRSFAPSPAGNGERIYSGNYGTNLSVSWQSDIFGRVRNAVDAAEAGFQATSADRDALEQTLVGELARRLLSHEINMELLGLAEENLENRRAFLELVERRYELGSVSVDLSDIYLAREAYTSVEAEIAEFNRVIQDNLYRIDVLLGERPGYTDLDALGDSIFTEELPALAPVYPASLLDNRPDLVASEFRVYAAEANVNAAVAELYPSLGISAGLSLSSMDLSDLFDLDELVGSIASSIVQPIFRGGSTQANVRLKESELREIAFDYESKVLEAIREVETALQAEQQLSLRLESQSVSVDALRNAEAIAEQRYKDGLQTLQSYLEIQQRRYLAEQNKLLTHQQQWNTRIDLYLALGGKVSKES
jgi:NodT family efflux transporter outer membrane factor (OMF) lipoprotein